MVESPQTRRFPISPGATGRPSSSTMAHAYPGAGSPEGRGRDGPGRVRQEDVAALGRADAVDDLHAEALTPAAVEVGRQRLPCGHAEPEGGGIDAGRGPLGGPQR